MMELVDYIIFTEPLLGPAELDEIREVLAEVPWQQATTFHALEDFRTCSVFALTEAMEGRVKVGNALRHRLMTADAMLFTAVDKARQAYQEAFPRFSTARDVGYDLLRYETGQFYKAHTDRSAQFPRVLSLSLGLNDDYEGGEFRFFEEDYKEGYEFKLLAGQALMFPSNFMYPHQIRPVTRGTRYSMVTWFL
jgi:predicted 2-oxoglutarate/Fe(II)-dependent dioxygenase YbiX